MKRHDTWEKLYKAMSNKRTKQNEASNKNRKLGSAPHEIVVQKLSSEPDSKQTYRPIQPREFVSFEFDEITLPNLKSACAAHFGLPVSTCDVLVSNKGPSCTNIQQIPHRKDKVYLVRFVHKQDDTIEESESLDDFPPSRANSRKLLTIVDDDADKTSKRKKSKHGSQSTKQFVQSEFPTSISIGELLKAGTLVAPIQKQKALLTLERFDIKSKEWAEEKAANFSVCKERFSFGGFRDAFKCTEIGILGDKRLWVLKTYNEQAKTTIVNHLSMGVEAHARKQVQMHEVARHLTKKLQKNAPSAFGETFHYNKVFYTTFQDQPATLEEYIEGAFVKYVNNNGCSAGSLNSSVTKENVILDKAEALVHYSYFITERKMMLLDIQGSGYFLCDPEIATENLIDVDNNGSEILFCCGNLSLVAIEAFLNQHMCNKYCKMLCLQSDCKN